MSFRDLLPAPAGLADVLAERTFTHAEIQQAWIDHFALAQDDEACDDDIRETAPGACDACGRPDAEWECGPDSICDPCRIEDLTSLHG